MSIGMLLQTVIHGIPLDPLGMPQQTLGEMGLRMFNDAKAARKDGRFASSSQALRVRKVLSTFAQNPQIVYNALEG